MQLFLFQLIFRKLSDSKYWKRRKWNRNTPVFDDLQQNIFREFQLNKLYMYDMTAAEAQIWSGTKWINKGGTNTKFFLGLEKKHQTQNIVREHINENYKWFFFKILLTSVIKENNFLILI